MILNKQSIESQINNLLRNTVCKSVKKHFIPKVDKYIDEINKIANNMSIGDIQIPFNYQIKEIDKKIIGELVSVVAILLLEIPVIGQILAFLTGFIVDKFITSMQRKKQKEEITLKLHSEVFPKIISEVRIGIEEKINDQMDLVNNSIDEEVVKQKEAMEKAISDLRAKINEEKERKDKEKQEILGDLEIISSIKKSLI